VRAEYIWTLPEVGAGGPMGADDGTGGYMPLAVAVGSGAAAALHWVHADHMGVPLVTTSATGAVVTPTGYALSGFPGQFANAVLLPGAAHYYNRYRDYDPTTGRYIQADPIGLEGDPNPYAYALGNPLRYADPTGEFAIALPLMCAGGGCQSAVAAGAALFAGAVAWAMLNPINPWGDPGLMPPTAGTSCPTWPALENRAHPPGYWPADKGAEEWGRRNGVGKEGGRRRFHGIKSGDTGSRGKDNYGVDPSTGDVIDPSGESVGNLND
jgi:RHS repeat-associated protein